MSDFIDFSRNRRACASSETPSNFTLSRDTRGRFETDIRMKSISRNMAVSI